MIKRIEQIMKIKDMNQRDFAAAIGIAAATLNSMLKGHTSPTNKTIQAIHHAFPEISITWLMFNEGEMLIGENQAQAAPSENKGSDASQPASGTTPKEEESFYVSDGIGGGHFETTNKEVSPTGQVIIREVKYLDKPQRQITEIKVFYDDGTFDTFPGKHD